MIAWTINCQSAQQNFGFSSIYVSKNAEPSQTVFKGHQRISAHSITVQPNSLLRLEISFFKESFSAFYCILNLKLDVENPLLNILKLCSIRN